MDNDPAADLDAAREELVDLPEHVAPTEDGVARAFCAVNAGRFVYDHTSSTWFVWRGGRWERDTQRRVFDTIHLFTRAVYARFAKPPSALAKRNFVSAVEYFAQTTAAMAVSQEVWDTDPWLLGTPGGVVDLRTGTISDARPELYISKHTSIAPAPAGTPAPLWRKFLNQATKKDKNFQAFLSRLSGYILTGDVTEEILVFLYGGGGNGKGVLVSALIGVLGEYAVSMPIEAFTTDSRVNPEYYRAQMAGARLVTASETEVRATWAEAQIKDLTGNEAPVSARHPHCRPFTYWPQFKVVIVGNHAPKLRGRSPAMERRLRILPFTHTPPKPDMALKDKLKAEYPAILREMIEGCLVWQRKRLGSANVVRDATDEYFAQQDAYRRWLDDRCKLDEGLSLKPSVLLADFNSWARENGIDEVLGNEFAEKIDQTPGLKRVKSNGVRLVKGIGLAPPPQPFLDDEGAMDGPEDEDNVTKGPWR